MLKITDYYKCHKSKTSPETKKLSIILKNSSPKIIRKSASWNMSPYDSLAETDCRLSKTALPEDTINGLCELLYSHTESTSHFTGKGLSLISSSS
jgi:hypothetical protein